MERQQLAGPLSLLLLGWQRPELELQQQRQQQQQLQLQQQQQQAREAAKEEEDGPLVSSSLFQLQKASVSTRNLAGLQHLLNMGQQQQQQASEELQQLQLLFSGRGAGTPEPQQQQQQQPQQQQQLGGLTAGATGAAAAAAEQYLAAAAKGGDVVVPSLGPPGGAPMPFGLPQSGRGPPAAVGGPPRVLLFVDRPTRPFALQDGDIRSCLATYGPLESVVILSDRAAAEISFVAIPAAAACVRELDSIQLEGVGVLRAVLLPPGVPAAAALPDSAADPPRQQQQQQQQQLPPAAAEGTGPQWFPGPLVGAPAPHDPRPRPHHVDPAAHLLQQQQQQQQQALQQQLQHGSSSSNVRRVCRLELVGLFSEEPAFSVAAAIRGTADGNIKFILEQTKHKVDLGIRGKPLNEAPVVDRLHVTLSADDAEAFDKALAMTEDLVQSVCDQFVSYCRDRQLPLPPSLGFRRHMYQQQMDAGGPGLPGPLIYLGAFERFRAGGGGGPLAVGGPAGGPLAVEGAGGPAPAQQQNPTQAVSPAAAAASAAAAAAASTGGAGLLPALLPPGVLPPGPLSLAALAAAGLAGGPLGPPLVPPGALGAPGVLGPPPIFHYRGPNAEYDEFTRNRSRSRDRGPHRDRDGMYRRSPPRRGGHSGRQIRRGARLGPPGRGLRGPDDGGP
ncbi:hypothetical protein Efla_000113 [Eimeria flavescens]